MNSQILKQADGTIELTITIPISVIEKARNEVIDEHTKVEELPGFRKGMAPRDLVEKSLSKDHVREDVLRKVLPQEYVDAVNEHKLNPVLNPKINVTKLGDLEPWEFKALTAEAPKITLGKYKDAVREVTAKSKILVPGKEPQAASFEEISKVLMESAELLVPKIVIDQEVDRLLAQMLDEVKKLGLTLDQYLSSTGRNIETIRKDYEVKAINDIKLEFILQEIAKEEGIKVEEKEIEDAINQAKTEAEKQNLEGNKSLLSSIIRQQKTLDFLRNL